MSDRHSVSRRQSLKEIGAMGAALALGGVRPLEAQTPGDQEKPSTSVVDVAADRMLKGHS